MQTIKKLLFLLNSNEHKRVGLLLAMILLMAILDVIGVASILPFMAVLTNPSLIETNLILNMDFFLLFNNEQAYKPYHFVDLLKYFLMSLQYILDELKGLLDMCKKQLLYKN